ncbi:MAG: UDP-N-acetylmuramoyl-L-alanine--D-glutamate ligase, partial [Anaerolinea sp.]|nr:UDP-N-acetylmuramoyl-L-alanine--D-glutamate ligase [Anaerolinea sp.]
GARQGQAAARWLTRHGAHVTVNDQRPLAEMHAAQSALADLPVSWALGGHPLELLDETEVVCLSGGVPLTNPILAEALKRGIQLTNDTQIFMEIVPCPTIGITGSAGKTTTTTLVGRMAQKVVESLKSKVQSPRARVEETDLRPADLRPFDKLRAGLLTRVFVGGNIGDPLLNYVNEMQPGDLAILEISSFQLEQMTISPNIAAILNITPNHLDRHGTMEAYTAAKARILEFQTAQDMAILGRDDPGAWDLRPKVRGRLYSFGFSPMPEGGQGTFLRQGVIYLRTQDEETVLLAESSIQLRGDHNRLNVLAACTIACAAGLPLEAIKAGIQDFHGVAHRLELVREWNGARWYNDSIATAPERSMAAIRAFDEPIVLLLGGRDKNLPWDELAALVHERVAHVVLFGEAAEKINAALGLAVPGGRPFTLARCAGLEEAVQAAAGVAEAGDVVLLSPGGTSFDEFRDFEERGEVFRKWVSELS